MTTPLPLADQISRTSSVSVQDNSFAIDLGDGYLQSGSIGLNPEYELWSVVWQELSTADFATLKTTLSAVGTALPLSCNSMLDGASKLYKVVANSRKYQPMGNGLWTVTITLRQVYAP